MNVSEPPLKGRLEAYLESYSDPISLELAGAFHDPNKPVAHTAIIIPVAAHQEDGWIRTSMSQYARQEEAEPFTIFLYLNSPMYADRAAVAKSIKAVQQAQADFPGLDIRYAERECDSYSPAIGEIRKDVWDAVLRVALLDSVYDAPDDDLIAINHDIDTPWIGRHYVRNVQQHYRGQREMYGLGCYKDLDDVPWELIEPRHTQVTHEYPFDTHPNIAKAIFWDDFVSRQRHRGGSYTNGIAISFLWYAKKRGFDISRTSYEFDGLCPDTGMEGILLTPMHTSHRRYIHRLGAYGLKDIWAAGSFSAYDKYRTMASGTEDISVERLRAIFLEIFDDDIAGFPLASPERCDSIVRGATKYMDNELRLDMWLYRQVAPLVERRLNVVQLPEFTKHIDRAYEDRAVHVHAKRLKDRVYLTV